jgi:type IV pilus assembly protein PilA
METRSRGAARGISLVELLVTLALFAFLILLGVPLTHAWVQSAHQRDASGMLAEGLGRAKALALRNSQGVTDQTLPVAAVCLMGGRIQVTTATKDGIACATAVSWSATLPFDASIVKATNQSAFQCVAYNERGMALAASVSGLTCTQSPSDGSVLAFNVMVGNETALSVPLP